MKDFKKMSELESKLKISIFSQRKMLEKIVFDDWGI